VTSTPLGALAAFHPLVRRWFTERFDAPTDAQARAWPAIARGEHVLVSAPTGSGKTLTAFLAVLDNLITGRWGGGAVRALYLSPLKALNTDVRQNLLVPLAELRDLFEREGVPFPSLRVLTRSGDTPDDERRAMLRRPPEILITTPESLNLMLTGTQSRRLFADLRIVILDEIHALAASKRGTYMMSAVERLAWAAGEIQRVALSATVHPVERIAAWMAGFEVRDPGPEVSYRARPVTVIASADRRELALRLCTPDVESSRGPDAADLWWQALAAELKAVIGRNRATLLFANSRRSVEKLVRLLNAGEPEPIAYSHHGSLSRELRLDVEARMKQGRLRAVVATGSLELGIDIGSVDEVVLIGTPPSVAQTLQRIGRADHRVGGTSKARLFSLHGLDHAQAAAMAEMVGRNALEALRPIANPLDVLAQLLLSLGCGVRWDLDQLFAQVRGIAAYRTLPRRHFDLVVAMLAGRYADVPVRDLKARALVDRVANTFTTRPAIHAAQVAADIAGAVTVLHPIKAVQVGSCLHPADHKISRNAVHGVRHGNVFDNFRAHSTQNLGGAAHGGFDLRRQRLLVHFARFRVEECDAEVIGREANAHALDALFQRGQVILHRHGGRRRIGRIHAGDGLQHQRRIGYIAGNRAWAIDGGCKSDQPIAGDAPVGGFQPHHAAKRGRLANGTAGIGSNRERSFTSGNCRCPAA